jgi:hypothetical protein
LYNLYITMTNEPTITPSITYASCFYILKSKFDKHTYINWMNNLVEIANDFNLVIYTDLTSSVYIDTKGKPNIKIILKHIEDFYTYKYKDFWIKNHTNNHLLNNRVVWEVNMLWSEKVFFVYETMDYEYFKTDYYGWIDIGYFRNRNNDLSVSQLLNWSGSKKINELSVSHIHYGCVSSQNMDIIKKYVDNKNSYGLPVIPIPQEQCSIAGGFFITHSQNIEWWKQTYDDKLSLYFTHNYLVKDDQIIILDCICSNPAKFQIFFETNPKYDNWFQFQRLLQ